MKKSEIKFEDNNSELVNQEIPHYEIDSKEPENQSKLSFLLIIKREIGKKNSSKIYH